LIISCNNLNYLSVYIAETAGFNWGIEMLFIFYEGSIHFLESFSDKQQS